MLGVWLRSIVQGHNTHQKYFSLLPLPITLAYYTFSLPKLTSGTHYLYSLPYLYKLINALPYFWHRGWTHPSCANPNTKGDILKQMEGRCWDANKLRGLWYHIMIILMTHCWLGCGEVPGLEGPSTITIGGWGRVVAISDWWHLAWRPPAAQLQLLPASLPLASTVKGWPSL